MKNLILILPFLFGCGSKNARQADSIILHDGRGIHTYIIDSCEYIGDIEGAYSYLAHKGNCKYCKKRQK